MTLISQAEYSRRIGVSRAAISQMKTAGRLIMSGSQVDVEATDARLKRLRRDGLPDVDPSPPIVKRGRPSVKQRDELNTEPIRLTGAEIDQRIADLDWKRNFDWSDAAQHDRAVLAAKCIGWEAVTSAIQDDGHWGGYQLRIPGYAGVSGPHAIDGVAAGHGFELDVWDVIRICRTELEPIDDDDDSTVRIDLLPLLAHPFSEHDKQR